MKFIELTDKNGHKVYINFSHVQRFYRMEWYNNTSFTILHLTDKSSVMVHESVDDILDLIKK